MKKKVYFIISAFILILSFYVFYNWKSTNNEVLYIGKQVSLERIDFRKQIKDRNKINKVTELLNKIEISNNEEMNGYADIVIRLDVPKKSINIIFAELWITSNGAKVKISENTFGTLSSEQVDQLKEIIGYDKI